MLEGFKPMNLATGLPYISITSNGLTFNKTSVIRLEKPKHVALLINEEKKQIAVQVCDEDDETAIPFLKNPQKAASVRWNNKDLLNTLSKLMDWNLNEQGYRVNGDYLAEESAMIFDLNTAVTIGAKD